MKPSPLRPAALAVLVVLVVGLGRPSADVRAGDESPEFYNGLARPNGKQIARTADRWLVVTPDPSGREARLSVASGKTSIGLEGWKHIRFLTADDRGVFRSQGPSPVPPSLAFDRSGRLHAAWGSGDGVWYARAAAENTKDAVQLGRRDAWTSADGHSPQPILADAALGDIALAADGQPWIAAIKRGADRQSTLCVGRYAGKWVFEDLAQDVGFHAPVLQLADDNSAHVAWSDTRGRILYLRYRPGEKAELRVICRGGFYPNGRNPAIISHGRQLIVAYESLYSQIECLVEEDGQWRALPSPTSKVPRFAPDVLHSAQLARDRHGVVWMFFSDTTRRFTYFTRWLGSEWGEIYECRGIYYRSPRFEADLLAADWLSIEKYPPAEAAEIGLAMANSLAKEKDEFHRIAVPAPTAAAGSTTLFFDMLEVAQQDQTELTLDEARKSDKNPVLSPGQPGDFDQDRVLNHGSVAFTGDRFQMWYGAAYRRRGVAGWWEWMSTGYAESKDGLAWEKVATGASAPSSGAGKNRLPELPWPCAVFRDLHDPNPAQRYKVVQFDRHQIQVTAAYRGEYDMDAPTCPGQLHQSPDGVHWKSEPISIAFPDGKPWELVVQSFFIDPAEPDPARRWKAYGYATLVAKRRAGCFAYSADGRHWVSYPRNAILDPTVSQVPMVPSGPIAQIHDTVVFPYRGYYLAMFHDQHDAYFLDVELALSRDGANFSRVKPGNKVIALGPRGAWDWQQILQTAPVAAHDQLWLYYGGQHPPPEIAEKPGWNNELLVGGAGLATLRLDGFTHLALKSGQTSGSVTTVAYEIPNDQALRLVVNAQCPADSSIAVELLDAANGQPLPGFARRDCTPLAGDWLRSAVHWKGGDRLPADRGRVAFRFLLSGQQASPKLYAFGFLAEQKAP